MASVPPPQVSLADARLAINASGPGTIIIGPTPYTRSLLIHPGGLDPDWGPDTFAQLDTSHIQALIACRQSLILLGTGIQQHFLPGPLLRMLIDAGIGIECMDTAAACRTHNILLAEGRSFASALIIAPLAAVSVPA